MAEQREKSHSILLRTQGKMINVELFDARLWPAQAYDDGLYRVRVNDVWHCPTGKYSFLTQDAVGKLIISLLHGGETAPEPFAPYLPHKARVRVFIDDAFSSGSVHAPPHQEADGRWYVWCWIFGKGPVVKIPVNDVKLIK